jgi:hypothetical protein
VTEGPGDAARAGRRPAAPGTVGLIASTMGSGALLVSLLYAATYERTGFGLRKLAPAEASA